MNFAWSNSHKLLLGIRDIEILKFHSLHISFLVTFNEIFYKISTVKWITYISAIQKKRIKLWKVLLALLTFQQMNHFRFFKPKRLNVIEIIRDKKEKRPDNDAIHHYIMKTSLKCK